MDSSFAGDALADATDHHPGTARRAAGGALVPPGPAGWRPIEDAYHRYGAAVFPDRHRGREQHVASAHRFGEIDRSMVAAMNVDGTRGRIPITATTQALR
ncbi:MAG: hypothetical protein R2749_27885 [Acidimicrobiales bacterium]